MVLALDLRGARENFGGMECLGPPSAGVPAPPESEILDSFVLKRVVILKTAAV